MIPHSIVEAVDTSTLLARSLTEWKPILAKECQVYATATSYIAKRFDQINYKFCEKNEAKEVLIDNLYALLRFKYFPKLTDEIDERIERIIKAFTVNLKTTLLKVSFNADDDCVLVGFLPDGCVAFRNGVYDFRKNSWLFKYEQIRVKRLANTLYFYDPKYIILWYMNFDFEPIPEFDISEPSASTQTFIDYMKDWLAANPEKHNYCFELAWNIAHDGFHKFNIDRFNHLAEILGYTLLQSFSQNFVMLIGSGQNGKNSLFDGCFTDRLIPRPSSNDLDAIENDRFITGTLENCCHNIFLETSAKTYTESKMIKALTGSMYQTVESKGIAKYSSIINCKYVFAGNDQELIKFSDTTTGFRRRINLFEIYYQWDSGKRFLKFGDKDYYDTTFSDSLIELKSNLENVKAYIYLGILGIKSATKNFTSNFQFTSNDWDYSYSDIDYAIKETFESITPEMFGAKLKAFSEANDCTQIIYDINHVRLINSDIGKDYGIISVPTMLEVFADEEASLSFFADNDIYVQTKFLKYFMNYIGSMRQFNTDLKKTFGISNFERLADNLPFVKLRFMSGKLRILK